MKLNYCAYTNSNIRSKIYSFDLNKFSRFYFFSYYLWSSIKMIYIIKYTALRYVVIYYHGYKTLMRAERLRSVPPVPVTLAELAEILMNYQPLRHLYKGSTVGSDGSSCLIFLDDRMINALSSCNHLFCNDTFNVRW